MIIEELLSTVRDSLRGGSCASRTGWTALYDEAVRNSDVRRIVGWPMPAVEDLTEYFGLTRGRVLAVRLDKLAGGVGHKVPVVAGLLVRRAVLAAERTTSWSGFLDGGNVSTALAMAYFAKRFATKAEIVLSRYMPDDVVAYLKRVAGDRLAITIAPPAPVGIEREFYEHVRRIAWLRHRGGVRTLWHAKHGGAVLRPLADEWASRLHDEEIDVIALTLGAGATLEGWAAAVQDQLGGRPSIIVGEHELCPLVNFATVALNRKSLDFGFEGDETWVREPPAGIPHSVMGPHYDELNPCIAPHALSRISGVVRYSDAQWRRMAAFCRAAGLSVGNSSAVNLMIARAAAETGRSVLTFIYEPLREYYVASQAASSGNAEQRSVCINE